MFSILPKNVEFIIERLEKHGYRADIVGGSVRDILLGKTPDDYDITTSAPPDETKRVFSDLRTVDTGIKHGTVSVILDGKAYEVTTYRVDGEYRDARHPESVSFTSRIEDDLARRDFTVNAMAYSPEHGITDPYGGRADLEKRVIRAVGDPYLRFSEDALRILRGVRFSAALGFEIEGKTAAALIEKKSLLKNVSAERIFVEIKKTFSAPYAFDAISSYSEIVSEVVPTLKKISLPQRELFSAADPLSRFASVFYTSCENPTDAFDTACRTLRTDTHFRETGRVILSSIEKYDGKTELSLIRALRDVGRENTEALLRLRILLGMDDGDALDRFNSLILSDPVYSVSHLRVNGGDIMSLGIRGKAVGDTLEMLLTAVIDGKAENERETLLEFAKNTLLSNR